MRLIFLLLCLSTVGNVAAAPRVVTSIAPLHEIVSDLMQGVSAPELIIDAQFSSHHFSFRPSQLRLLQQADLVIWVDRHFEAGFNRMPDMLPSSAQQLELLPALALAHNDGHIWYSTKLLAKTVDIIALSLVRLDPEHRAIYAANAKQLSAHIAAWHQQALQRWQNLEPRFITDHRFSNHLEQDLGIAASASLYRHHDAHAGLSELKQIETRIQENPPLCLLSLESSVSSLAQNLAEKYRFRVIRVPLQPIPDSDTPKIVQRLEQLNSAMLDCS